MQEPVGHATRRRGCDKSLGTPDTICFIPVLAEKLLGAVDTIPAGAANTPPIDAFTVTTAVVCFAAVAHTMHKTATIVRRRATGRRW